MNSKSFARLAAGIALAGAAFAASATAAPAADGKIAIKAGRVVTLAGDDIENGTIVIENGRITAIGQDVKIPWDAEVIDKPDLVAFPGFVEALTNRGMDRSNENIDVVPFLDVRDSIDPVNFFFEDALRSGITTLNVQQGGETVIGAQGHVVKPLGMTVEQMSVKPRAGLVIAASPKRGKSPATQAEALRAAFGDLRRYLEGAVADARDGKDQARREALYQGREPDEESAKGRPMGGSAWKVDGLELVPRWEIDEKQAPLLALVEGKVPAFVYCDSPMDVRVGIRVAKENGFLGRTTFVLGSECFKAVDELKAAGRPVILSPTLVHVERDPVTGDEVETFVPGVFHDAGVPFALRSTNSTTQSLWFQAAMCVGHGLDRETAVAATTKTAAEILGLGDRVGSLEVGKDGNVLLCSGDPLSVTSFIEYVVIEGDLAYDRSQDVRVRHLLTGEQPENTAPADGAGEEDLSGDGEGDDGGDDEDSDGE